MLKAVLRSPSHLLHLLTWRQEVVRPEFESQLYHFLLCGLGHVAASLSLSLLILKRGGHSDHLMGELHDFRKI